MISLPHSAPSTIQSDHVQCS
ncbi:hypothetical protein D030_2540A, partial [Vibrio parahaemolyticus AQ3810]